MTSKFILGVGAQKAGTTWLHRYVAPVGPMKEYHIWNTLFGPHASRISTGFDFDNPLRQSMLANPEFYFDHFSNGGADITPSYAALSADVFRFIRDGFEKRGVEVAPIFIMRDPVERVWSAWKMYHRRGLTQLALEEFAVSAIAKAHGSYERTVPALEAAFESVWIGVYEQLLDDLESLSAYLGVAYRPELVSVQHNAAPAGEPVPDEARRGIARHYAATYSFCFDRFPHTRASWMLPA